MNKFLGIIYALLLCTSAMADDQLALTDKNKPLLITNLTDSFTINLPSNVSTGYSWLLSQYDSHIIQPLTQELLKQTPNLPGGNSIVRFTFKMVSGAFNVNQITPITFIYVRPWNMDIQQTITFKVILEAPYQKST